MRRHGFTIDQVVHDCDDLRRSIVELAFRKAMPLAAEELIVLDIGLNKTIAMASKEILRERGVVQGAPVESVEGHMQEMRNLLNTARLAFSAIRSGGVGLAGSTATGLDRSLQAMDVLIDQALDLARQGERRLPSEAIDLSAFILGIQVAVSSQVAERGGELTVLPVEHGVLLDADRPMLGDAVTSLLVHATERSQGAGVVLGACASGGRVFIEVRYENALERGELADSRFADCSSGVSAIGGELRLRSLPGGRQVATIDLPQSGVSRQTLRARLGVDRPERRAG